MNREELIKKIADDLLDNDLLNVLDCSDTDALLSDVIAIIAKGLQDYQLWQGIMI